MKNDKFVNTVAQLAAATERYQEALEMDKNDIVRDSAIKRFEFTFELLWKTLKLYLENNGLHVYSPREAIKGAFKNGLIEDNKNWLDMITTRNLTAHVYNEDMAEKIYKKLPKYLPLIKKLINDLSR